MPFWYQIFSFLERSFLDLLPDHKSILDHNMILSRDIVNKKFECPLELNEKIKQASNLLGVSDKDFLIVATESFLRLSPANQSLEIAKFFELRAKSLPGGDEISK